MCLPFGTECSNVIVGVMGPYSCIVKDVIGIYRLGIVRCNVATPANVHT